MYNKNLYYSNDDFTITLEEFDSEVFAHIQFNKITRPILLDAFKVWAEIKAKMYWAGYERVFAYTADKRMKRLFPGWTKEAHFNWDGNDYEVLEWELN